MSLFVERNLLRQLGHEMRPFRTWAHKAHLAFQDVPELRNLVDSNLTYDPTDACSASVALTRPNRTRFFGVNSHRAKLHQGEWPTVLPYPVLLVKDRTARFQLDQNSGDDNDGQRENQADQRHQPVHRAPKKFCNFCLPASTRENEPRGPKHIQRDATGESLVE